MLVLAEDMKNGGWYKKWSLYIYAILAAVPQVLPLVVDELQHTPHWFRSTLSILAVLGIAARAIKQDGFKPAQH